MDKYRLTNLDVACQNALQVLVKPRFYYLIEPWLMNAKEQQKKALIMAADYVEGKSSGTLLPAVHKNRHGLRRPKETCFRSLDQVQHVEERPNVLKREGTKNQVRLASEVAEHNSLTLQPVQQQEYAFLLHPVASAKIEDWQVTEGTAEDKAMLAEALKSLMLLRETLPGYDEKSIPTGIEPTDRLYLESYCRRIRAEASSGHLQALSGREAQNGRKAHRFVGLRTPHSHYLESHLYFPFTTVDFTTTNQRMMKPPPPGHGLIDSPQKDKEIEMLKSSLISPIILSEKLAMQ
ncbi:conserved hypothetical protein [Neospora caninum Liverpool]|uniref:Uncharacterized protein n=1 Tax=Neospora caninum (strain Liverpool) TaxID=572307 RepID=F0VJA4_NEOCL|nr:conserved hypothetical protein [Neospora caninum Liverpool]CBZ53815.1 conserved hypothetical protein [Neospora caninum Liverpool]CEL67809.1 TPA: hypothetical protein BN1204_035960 [Neospora caninum Liverpool]|eukprot:XP_003883847.1 conserved hypothetical protein [Neospora caninum Liverpool]